LETQRFFRSRPDVVLALLVEREPGHLKAFCYHYFRKIMLTQGAIMNQVRTLPLVMQSMYSELVEQALVDRNFGESDPGVTPVRKTVKGHIYWYLQQKLRDSETGRQRQEYFGPDNAETRKSIEAMFQRRKSAQDRKLLVSALKGGGAASPHPVMGEVLKQLSKDGFFDSGGLVVGTVAYQTYEAALGVKFTGAWAMTQDVDVAKERVKSVEVVTQQQSEPFLDRLRRIDPSFREVPSLRHGPTGSYVNGEKVRVDVLTPAGGKNRTGSQYLIEIQSHAQRLEYLDYLLKEPVKAVVLYDTGILVNVPQPQRYAVHKLIVSQSRDSANFHKVAKDVHQAQNVVAALLSRDRGGLQAAFEAACAKGSNWTKKLRRAVQSLDAKLREDVLTLVPVLQEQ
jgi:hypothetical protein